MVKRIYMNQYFMSFELTKSEKKIAREIIEIGLQKEYAKGLFQFDSILVKWKDKKLDSREAYQQLYDKLIRCDKHIARRYDRMSGSNYLFIIAAQLIDGVISEKDLEKFSEQTKQAIKLIANI